MNRNQYYLASAATAAVSVALVLGCVAMEKKKSLLCAGLAVLGLAGLVGSAILSSQPTRQAARELTVKDLLDDRDVARLETNISEVLGETL